MANERAVWATDLVSAAKKAGLWEDGISTAKLAKRIETQIGKAYGDRQITRWLTADEKYRTPDSDVRTRVLALLTESGLPGYSQIAAESVRKAREEHWLLTYEDEAEKNNALFAAIVRAEKVSAAMVEEVERLRAIFEADVVKTVRKSASAADAGALKDDAAALAEIGDRVQEQVAAQRKTSPRKARVL